ncbi:MAG: lytic transglycosylase domain-containing protein [Bacteriovoracaceae bacterium]|jgi:soluble lytic murein transglycosylase|nr:lytic transglycosylase domain-containing protein [Bacteriovoracaceae bacterium]
MEKLINGFIISFLIFNISFAKDLFTPESNIKFYNNDFQIAQYLVNVFEKNKSKQLPNHLYKKLKGSSEFSVYKDIVEHYKKINNSQQPHLLCQNNSNITKGLVFAKDTFVKLCFSKIFKNKKSIKNLKLYIGNTPDYDAVSEVLFSIKKYIKKNKKKLKNEKKLLGLIEKKKREKSLVKSLRYKSNRNRYNKEFNKEFKLILDKIADGSVSAKKVHALVKTLRRNEKLDMTRQIADQFLKYNSKDPAILFEHLWSFIKDGKYQEAYNKTIRKYDLHDSSKNNKNSKLMFWVAHTLNKIKKESNANSIYSKIIEKHPLSYYAIMAKKHLPGTIHIKKVDKQLLNIELSLKMKRHLRVIRSFIAINSYQFLDYEIKRFQKEYIEHLPLKEKRDFTIKFAKFLQKNDSYLESFKVVYKSIGKSILDLNLSTLDLLYPRPYFKILKKNKKYFDPYIALSLVRQESSFNPNATSRVGASGLMQLMPTTAQSLSKRFKTSMLTNPYENIRLGMKYLKQLDKNHKSNFVHILASYNAGERKVNKWKKKYFISKSLFKNIENIPYDETRKYVKLIFRNLYFYNYLDNAQGRTPAHSEQEIFKHIFK